MSFIRYAAHGKAKENSLIVLLSLALSLCVIEKITRLLSNARLRVTKIVVMAKVQQISSLAPSLSLTEYDINKEYEESLQKSGLDGITT